MKLFTFYLQNEIRTLTRPYSSGRVKSAAGKKVVKRDEFGAKTSTKVSSTSTTSSSSSSSPSGTDVKFRRSARYYHPITREIKDPKELRRHPRYSIVWREHELPTWLVYRNFPHYAQFFPKTDDSQYSPFLKDLRRSTLPPTFASSTSTSSSTSSSSDEPVTQYCSEAYLPPWGPKSLHSLESIHLQAKKYGPAYKVFWNCAVDVKPRHCVSI